jgi:hypothetical protein
MFADDKHKMYVQDFALIFCSFYWRCLSPAFVYGYDTCEKAALYISAVSQGLDAEPEGV